VLCEVTSIDSDKYPYLKRGDLLLVHHNYLLIEYGEGRYLFERDYETGIAYFSIPVTRNIYARVNGGEVEPVCENIICERIEIPYSGIIIRPVKAYYDDRVRVLKIAPEVRGIKIDDVISIYKFGDMEISYSLDNKEQTAIKVWKEDVMGVFNGEEI
jgi:hypothetical protein